MRLTWMSLLISNVLRASVMMLVGRESKLQHRDLRHHLTRLSRDVKRTRIT